MPACGRALNIAPGQIYSIPAGQLPTGYDRVICEALSGIMARGAVTEAELSRRELAAFMRLAAREETLARIEHLLDTGKPLRN